MRMRPSFGQLQKPWLSRARAQCKLKEWSLVVKCYTDPADSYWSRLQTTVMNLIYVGFIFIRVSKNKWPLEFTYEFVERFGMAI